MTGFQYVEAAEIRRSPIRVALSPIPSLSAALRDAAGAARYGTPDSWCTAIRSHLRERDYETLAPFLGPGPLMIPDALLGLVEPPGESLKDGIERMLATPTDELAREMAECRALSGNPSWHYAERDPDVWLRRYVTSLLRGWKGFGPVWRQARPALDRETERVAVAAVLDGQLELLDGLLPTAGVRDQRWCIDCEVYDGRMHLHDEGLVLMPLVGGHLSRVMAWREGAISLIGYGVPLRRAAEPPAHEPAALEALIGGPRANVLRALTAPTSIGRLAEAMRVVPSVATYHVDALQAAGLVERDRNGRQVLVRRTDRGERLLALYGESRGAARTVAAGRAGLRAV